MWRCEHCYVINIKCTINKDDHIKCHHVNLLIYTIQAQTLSKKHKYENTINKRTHERKQSFFKLFNMSILLQEEKLISCHNIIQSST